MLSLPSPLNLSLTLTDEQFLQLCQQHQDLQFERSATGELIIMSPTGRLTGDRNSDLNFQLRSWNRRTKLGKVFDASTGFTLPNGSDRSPDAAWVAIDRWHRLAPEQQEHFLPLCPDFVVELRSPTDALSLLQAKMEEYRDNGARLGLLLDPQYQVVEIYCPGQEPKMLTAPQSVNCEPVLPGFVLELDEIF
ncbi:MAG: Uma2 family endonuclease [Cyanothece sp. SIO2G6]|nr:Uma2 family endonuclease [Cyanothece sp. SIO2G6]